jgi:hypothetical protein
MKIKVAFIHDVLSQVQQEKISFSRMVELINEEADKPNPEEKSIIPENWNKSSDGKSIDVPDVLMPLFNKIGMQLRFHTISDKSEVLTIADTLELSRKFFKENKETLI